MLSEVLNRAIRVFVAACAAGSVALAAGAAHAGAGDLSLDIKANGVEGEFTINSLDTLYVTVECDPGSRVGELDDWWVLCQDMNSGVILQYSAPYTTSSWVAPWNGNPSYQGDLFAIPYMEVLRAVGLPVGDYVFFFGVDSSMNGVPDGNLLTYKSLTVHVVPGGRTDDRFESNDTFATATDLTKMLADTNTLFCDLYVAASNEDLYKITLSSDSLVAVDCLFTMRNDIRDDSDLELAIYRANGDRIMSSESHHDNEYVNALGVAGETLYIRVWGSDNSSWVGTGPSSNNYALHIGLTPKSDDRFENNDTYETASDLSDLLSGNSLTADDLFGAPTDKDWYEIPIAGAARITVNCLFNQRNDGFDDSDLDVSFYDGNGNLLAEGTMSGDNETLTVDFAAAGTLYVCICGADNRPWGGRGPSWDDYSLQATIQSLP